jgi:hypothetical protein
MNWNAFLRQSHRWLSLVFTLTVIANFAAIFMGLAVEWLYYLPLPPLFLLMFTGLYMFFRPYFSRRRAAG